MNYFDVIVLGVGGMGSAALYELASRGRKVLGLEQFQPGHQRGSSHGQTRIIRQAYFEHPNYVPLVQRAYRRWYQLEQLTGRSLLSACPCLNAGPVESELIQGVRQSAQRHQLPIDELRSAEIQRLYPAFQFPESWVGVLEQQAGYLRVEDCVQAYVDAALTYGAVIRGEERVLSWRALSNGVEVQTDHGLYRAARLVITAGAWTAALLSELGLPLKVMRQVLLWFRPDEAELVRRDRFPIFIAETPGGYFYGLPMIDPRGVKAAQHFGAPLLDDPEAVDWNLRAEDDDSIRHFFRQYLPVLDQPRTDGQVCMYTLTPDKHFIIDRHPAYPQVSLACGFSGHGFKFSSVIGEILADLTEAGPIPTELEFFQLSRFRNG